MRQNHVPTESCGRKLNRRSQRAPDGTESAEKKERKSCKEDATEQRRGYFPIFANLCDLLFSFWAQSQGIKYSKCFSKDLWIAIVLLIKITRMVVMDESSLVIQSQQGDSGAFEQLIQQNQRMIHSLCYRMTGSLDDADDLAQETFIRAYQQIASFHGDSRFSSWIYKIAINQCLNFRKSRERQDRLQKEWAEEGRGPSGEEDKRSESVQFALMKLKPKQRAAVVLTAYEGLSHAEAAKVLRCSEATISWRVFAARGKLKRLLKEVGYQGETK